MPALPPPKPVDFERPWKVAVWAVAALCICAAIYLIFLCTLSFSALRSMALSAVPPGYEDRFTAALYARIILGLRLLASTLFLLALALVIFAKPLSGFLLRVFRDVAKFAREIARRIAELRHDPLHLIAFTAVLLGAVVLRLAFLWEPIRKDEAYTFMYYACRPLYVALTYYTANNHLLNTLLMHLSTSLLGPSLWTARLPTFVAGVLLVPVTYAATRIYHGKNAALIAAALTTASSPLIEFSFNARGYGLGALFFVLMIVLVGLTREGVTEAWIFLPVTAALSMYSVPTMMYGVGGVYLYLLIGRWQLRRTIVSMLCTGLLTVICYAPVLATVGPSAITNNKWVIPVARNVWPDLFGRELISMWAYWNLDLPKLILFLIGLGVAAELLSPTTLRLPPAATLFCVVVIAGLMLPVQRLVPYRRTWLFLLPLVFACAGGGFELLFKRFRSPDVLAAILALGCAAWMGGTVLSAKSLRHSGIEANGGRSAEAVVLGMKEHILHGDQFICAHSFDSGLDFEMYIHRIPYHPSRSGDLLIVTPTGEPPTRTFALAEIPNDEIVSIRKIARYEDEDVYLGVRGPSLPFNPTGSTEMGEFKTSGR